MNGYTINFNMSSRILRCVLVSYIFLALSFTPLISFSATISAWTTAQSIYSSGSVLTSATKSSIINGTSTIISSSARYIPLAVDIGSVALRYSVLPAIAYAVYQLIPAGTFYTLTNDGIVYSPSPNEQKLYRYYLQSVNPHLTANYYSYSSATSAFYQYYGGTSQGSSCQVAPVGLLQNPNVGFSCTNPFGNSTPFISVSNPQYDSSYVPPTTSTIPMTNLGQKIIDNANSGHLPSQQLLTTVIDDSLSGIINPPLTTIPATYPSILDKNAQYPSNTNSTSLASSVSVASGTATTTTTTTSSTLPKFCEYAPNLCEFLGWVKDDTLPVQNSTIPIDSVTPVSVSVPVSFGGSGCPLPLHFSVFDKTFDIPFTLMCQFLELIKPVNISMASLLALFIVFRN